MMLKAATIAFLFASGFLPRLGMTSELSHDGRKGTECPRWGKHPAMELCAPSLIRVLARAEDYDKRYIKLEGWLVRSKGSSYICVSMDLCANSRLTLAIQLPEDRAVQHISAIGTGEYVTAIGKFSATTRGRNGQIGGAFSVIDVVYSESDLPH